MLKHLLTSSLGLDRNSVQQRRPVTFSCRTGRLGFTANAATMSHASGCGSCGRTFQPLPPVELSRAVLHPHMSPTSSAGKPYKVCQLRMGFFRDKEEREAM